MIKFSLIGRPNVGKSSLINASGEDRVIASPVAGTTRDAIDTVFTDSEGQEFTMIDTAGMRKSGKVYEIQRNILSCGLCVLLTAQMSF